MAIVGVLYNGLNPSVRQAADACRSWLQERGHQVPFFAPFAPLEPIPPVPEADFFVVFGGDGTVLFGARTVAPTPLLGVNMGTLGFLSEVAVDKVYASLERVLAGEYQIEKRKMLNARVVRKGDTIGHFECLNDFVVAKGSFSRLIEVSAFVGDHYVTTYAADGLIVSTPTGSTAYSMSAGGPILAPDVDSLILTPICPHTLSARPIVVADDRVIRLELGARHAAEVALTVDGQLGMPLQAGDEVVITLAEKTAQFIRLAQFDFYNVLRTKLNWGFYCYPAPPEAPEKGK